jgi:hypothetical protein
MTENRRYDDLPTDIATAITRFELACYDLSEAVTTEGTDFTAKEVVKKRQALVAAIKSRLAPAVLAAGQTITLEPTLDAMLARRSTVELHLPTVDTEGGEA